MQYVVVEISGRQYLTRPGQTIEVDKLAGSPKKLAVDKVLLWVENGKAEIGTPYLKKDVNFSVVEEIKKPKIRVATYKAKSNYRRVKGQRRVMTVIKMEGEK